VSAGAAVVAGARPEHISLSANRPPGGVSVFDGVVVSALFEGGRVKYRVAMDELTVLAYGAPQFSAGDRVHVTVDPDQVILLPDLAAPATRSMTPA
jgi:ABC-type Fe3+/spermidine/putrescine transport system ATPase subunit